MDQKLPKIISKGAWLRLSSAVIGVVCVGLVFVVERLGGVLQVSYGRTDIIFTALDQLNVLYRRKTAIKYTYLIMIIAK